MAPSELPELWRDRAGDLIAREQELREAPELADRRDELPAHTAVYLPTRTRLFQNRL